MLGAFPWRARSILAQRSARDRQFAPRECGGREAIDGDSLVMNASPIGPYAAVSKRDYEREPVVALSTPAVPPSASVVTYRVTVLPRWGRSLLLPLATLSVEVEALTLRRLGRSSVVVRREDVHEVRIDRPVRRLPAQVELRPVGFGRRVVTWRTKAFEASLLAAGWPTKHAVI